EGVDGAAVDRNVDEGAGRIGVEIERLDERDRVGRGVAVVERPRPGIGSRRLGQCGQRQNACPPKQRSPHAASSRLWPGAAPAPRSWTDGTAFAGRTMVADYGEQENRFASADRAAAGPYKPLREAGAAEGRAGDR